MKVLLLEDNPADIYLIRKSFATMGVPFELETTGTLVDAIELGAHTTFDVILTDLELPDATRLEAVHALRAAAKLTPIIVLTGINDIGLSDQALDAGAQDYLQKGMIGSDVLRRSIRYAVHRQQVQNENLRLLEDVEQAKDSLKRKNRRLKQMYNMAQEFVDHVSHEFRTPLSVIKEYAALIHDGIVGDASDEQRRMLRVIDDRADDLNTMVDDMLDVSKLNAGLLGTWRKECTIEDIVQHVLPSLQRKAATRNGELTCNIDRNLPKVYCDAEKAGRVIVNLAVNAIKYSSPDAKVEIWARADFVREEVQVGITDNGPGIVPENIDRIFKRFTQIGRGSTDKCKSFGLGLSIAMELVELNFGTLTVDSVPDHGSTFAFTLPLAIPRRIVSQYLQRHEKRGHAGHVITLVRASLDADAEEEPANDVDRFLNYLLRRNDLLFRTADCEWLLVLATSRTELGDFLANAHKALNDTNRNRPRKPLPNIRYDCLGSWAARADEDEILAIVSYVCEQHAAIIA